MKQLRGKTVVITGAAGGLGSALAKALAEEGCHLALIDVNQQALTELAARLQRPSLRISSHVVNLCKKTEIDNLPSELIRAHPSIDVIINNAGMTLQKSIESHSMDDWQRVFNLNFWAAVSMCQILLPLLRQQNTAHIVNLSSMAAFHGLPSQCSYSSSKAALQAYSESLRAELSRDGIGVSCIHPGAIQTNMIMATLNESDDLEQAHQNMMLAQRFGISPEAAAKKIVRGIKGNSRSITIGADAKILKLVSTVLPGLTANLLARTYSKFIGA
ncbi:MAG: SDR family oxidoreductase [Zhongshania sp.]|nr:SDR family oxidoreductase [Zhongshania sp.]